MEPEEVGGGRGGGGGRETGGADGSGEDLREAEVGLRRDGGGVAKDVGDDAPGAGGAARDRTRTRFLLTVD